jgi:tetratricopeptide (TPR) repeat protein
MASRRRRASHETAAVDAAYRTVLRYLVVDDGKPPIPGLNVTRRPVAEVLTREEIARVVTALQTNGPVDNWRGGGLKQVGSEALPAGAYVALRKVCHAIAKWHDKPLLEFLMLIPRALFLTLLLVATSPFSPVFAEAINLQPKYGSLPKNEAQKAADEKFLKIIDEQYKGNRKKAADDLAARGWQFLREGKREDAMRRFNQAWLIDHSNGNALWGMAAVQGQTGKLDESLKLFAEAEQTVGGEIQFAADYAKTLGMAGSEARNDAMLKDAFSRFARIHAQAPQLTQNLQNRAITLFYVGNYAEAWKKIKLAEATPKRGELDPRFIADLQAKMPRP